MTSRVLQDIRWLIFAQRCRHGFSAWQPLNYSRKIFSSFFWVGLSPSGALSLCFGDFIKPEDGITRFTLQNNFTLSFATLYGRIATKTLIFCRQHNSAKNGEPILDSRFLESRG
jgi:hypothetical protein